MSAKATALEIARELLLFGWGKYKERRMRAELAKLKAIAARLIADEPRVKEQLAQIERNLDRLAELSAETAARKAAEEDKS